MTFYVNLPKWVWINTFNSYISGPNQNTGALLLEIETIYFVNLIKTIKRVFRKLFCVPFYSVIVVSYYLLMLYIRIYYYIYFVHENTINR